MKKLPQSQWARVKTASWWSSLANNPADLLLFILILFLPSQLGKHFWPPFSFVEGLRIDYLSPTLYMTDILLAVLIVELFPLLLKQYKKQVIFFCILVSMMVLAYSFGYLSQSSLLGSLRILETIIFALTCTYFLRRKSSYAIIRSGVSFSLLYTGILAIIQFILQQSAGGVWYWLGERTFDLTTPGIAAFSVDGTLILRSYATFAHPNVLGGYSLVMVVFLLFFKHAGTNPRVILFEKAGVIAGILAIILSMSRSSLMLLGLIGVVWCLTYMVTRKKQVLTLVMGVIALVVLSYTIVWQRLLSFSIQEQSVLVRRELIKETSIMIRDNPIFGVGVQNFLPTLTHYLPDSSPIAYFQPVHSMFLMILAETGFVGAGIFIVMVAVTIMKIQKSRAEDKAGKILLLVIFIALGIIDHYFYTLHQGQFLGAFLFAVLLM